MPHDLFSRTKHATLLFTAHYIHTFKIRVHTGRQASARFRTILVDLTLSSSSLLLYHISLLPGNFTPRVNLLSHSVAFTMARHTVAGACTREHKRQTVKMRHKLIPHDRANREAYGGRLASCHSDAPLLAGSLPSFASSDKALASDGLVTPRR